MPVYITPADVAADRQMDAAWQAMTRGIATAPDEIIVKGRHVAVPHAAGKAARFSFADLCEKPHGARDYLAMAGKYDTVFIDRIPVLADGRRNANANEMLQHAGHQQQTGGAGGKQVNRLPHIEDGADGIHRELYLSLLVDRWSAASRSSFRPKANGHPGRRP